MRHVNNREGGKAINFTFETTLSLLTENLTSPYASV